MPNNYFGMLIFVRKRLAVMKFDVNMQGSIYFNDFKNQILKYYKGVWGYMAKTGLFLLFTYKSC